MLIQLRLVLIDASAEFRIPIVVSLDSRLILLTKKYRIYDVCLSPIIYVRKLALAVQKRVRPVLFQLRLVLIDASAQFRVPIVVSLDSRLILLTDKYRIYDVCLRLLFLFENLLLRCKKEGALSADSVTIDVDRCLCAV